MEFKEYNNPEGYSDFCLAIDLGATHANLAVGTVDKKPVIIFKTSFESQSLSSIEDAINETLKLAKEKYNIEIKKASIAVPGPLNSERNQSTNMNLKYNVCLNEIKEKTMLGEVLLMNDFEAVSYGIPFVEKEEIKKGNKVEKGTICVIGPGTGLGASIAMFDTNKNMQIPFASEAGNMEFTINDEEDFKIMESIKSKTRTKKSIPYEQIVSGKGIIHLYDSIKEKHGRIEIIEKSENKAEEISINESETCKKTMEYFAKYSARLAKNLALSTVALVGV